MKNATIAIWAFLLLGVCAIPVEAAENYPRVPPNDPNYTLNQGIAKVKNAYNNVEDSDQRARLKAQLAIDVIRNRVAVLNSFENQTSTYLSTDGREIIRRRELLAAQGEIYGQQLAEAAWKIGGGKCEEHSTLMASFLEDSGVPNVKILRSSYPHAFVVVNLASDADQDNPFTWGPNAFVADSWSGQFFTAEQVWTHKMYFNYGASTCGDGSTDLAKFERLISLSPAVIERNCDDYKRLLKRFMLIPERYRTRLLSSLRLKIPEDACKGSWQTVLGRWRTENGAVMLISGGNGSLTAKVVERSKPYVDELVPDKATWFTNGSVTGINPVIIESNSYWAWPLGSRCPGLAPYTKGHIKLTLQQSTGTPSATLSIEDKAPNHSFSNCQWEKGGQQSVRNHTWTKIDNSP